MKGSSNGVGRLKAECVIHVVGPRHCVVKDDKLEMAIRNALSKVANRVGKYSNFPQFDGIYGYPYKVCAKIVAKVFATTLLKLSRE